MPDVLERIREEMSARLAELRPLAEEHTRLTQAVNALVDADSRMPVPAKPSPTGPPRPRAAKSPPATRRKRAPQGANRVAVLQAAEHRPGATRAELGTASGVEPRTLNALLGRLVTSGELRTEVLPTGRTGYSLGRAGPPAPVGS